MALTSGVRIYKNILVTSFAFLLLFTAFQSVQNLQSSINSVEGLGLASLSVIYGSLVISCMFVPSWLVAVLGCKRSLILSICCYGVYMLANMYPHWGTLIPTSVLLGTAAAPLWVAKCTYLTEMAKQHATNTHARSDAVTAHFFGVFFMAFQSSQVWGNLISSAVLGRGVTTLNRSLEVVAECCGANYCGSASELECTGQKNYSAPLIERPSDEKIYTLFGIYAGCAFMAALLVAVLLDPLVMVVDDGEEEKKREEKKINARLFIATLKNLRFREQILIIPLTMYSGLEQGFIGGDYTKSFVSCAWGVHQVGYVMITFGVCNAVCSFLWGRASNLVGRIPFILLASSLNLAAVITMLLWRPDAEGQSYVFFILAGMWGVADAVWQVLLNALYGVLFNKNEVAGFSNYRLWESLGFIIAYGYGDYLCVSVKIYIIISVLLLGLLAYLYTDTKYTYCGKERRHDV